MAFVGFGRCCLVGIVLLAFLGFGAYQASTLADNNVFRTWQSNVTNFVYGAWNASAAAAAAAASAPLLFKSRSDQNPQVFCPRISFPPLFVSLSSVKIRRFSVRHIFSSALWYSSSFKIRRFSVRHFFSSALCFLSSFKIRRFSVQHFFPLLCVSCRRSKSAGPLWGIFFPTICVGVVLVVISVYVLDIWMMIVSSLLIFECAADWNDRFPTLVLSCA
jgi:hypothetical protein